jgi:hypothetical protein
MMADFMFNVAKGRHAYYAMLPAADDSLVVVPIETTDIVGDSTMEDYATLDALLAGASNEQTTMGRKTLASVTSTVDNTNDLVKVDAADVVWTAATGNDISALVVCYKPTAASADSAVIPLYKYDFVIEVDGSDVTAVINTDGLAEAE